MAGYLGIAVMSRRKPHNPVKRLVTQTMIAVKDLALVMRLSGDDKVNIVSSKTKARVKQISYSLAQALNDTAFAWGVLLVVWQKESNGKLKTTTRYIKTAPYRHEALTDFLRSEHQEMIDAARGEVTDAGWVATPVAWSDDIDVLMECFNWTKEKSTQEQSLHCH